MKKFTVTGMSCAACVARVEKAVLKVNGVKSCSVSLLTNSMGVEGDADDKSIINAVRAAGYDAYTDKPAAVGKQNLDDSLKDTETPKLKKRLIWSVVFLAVLMYISMGYCMWEWWVPGFLDGNYIAIGLSELILSAVVMIINQRFFVSGLKAFLKRSPNMDTLVALGSAAAFVYSTYALFAMTTAQLNNDHSLVMSYMHEFYYESAAMILALITVGKMLEARSKGKTTDALKGLIRLSPKTAMVIRDGIETEINVDDVNKGDVFVVRPGSSIPVDGIVIEGESAVNESALTGESIPKDKVVSDSVFAGTINTSGFLKCEANRVGEDTTLSQIIKTVSDAAATKAPIAKTADKVSGVFVPFVIGIALITVLIWLILGRSVGDSLVRGIAVLVISCPCALGLATPVAIMVGSGMGAKNGILFKTAQSLEETGKAQIAVLDKTGTITKGEPTVTDIIPSDGVSEDELVRNAYSLEKQSEHPLARSVITYAEENGVDSYDVTDFKAVSGSGLTACVGADRLYGGSVRYVGEIIKMPDINKEQADKLSENGKTPLCFVRNEKFLGIIAVADTIKDESRTAVAEIKNMGLQVIMLTGDNEMTAKAIGAQAGVDEVIAGVMPNGKESVVRDLRKKGKVIMVGDGINDAPALTRADIGIAIGAGADVAIDAADVVLMKSRLSDVPAAIRLSRAVLRNIRENLFWAFIYNIIGIPLAAGAFTAVLGIKLSPMFAAAAMSLSSFCVVTNALRLNFFKMYSSKKDKKIKIKKKVVKKMEKKLVIEGMMCSHCEATVKKALESVDGVSSAEVSHRAGTAVVTLDKEVSDQELKKAVEDKEYKVISMS